MRQLLLYTYLYINSTVICACLMSADIFVKQQADEGSFTPSKALRLQEMPDMLLLKY